MSYSLTDTPWYFGAYLNQARHNLSIAFNDLAIKLGGRPTDDDGQLLGSKVMTVLKNRKDPVLLAKAMEYLDEKMPFLASMQYRFETGETKKQKRQPGAGHKPQPVKNLAADPERFHAILQLLIENLSSARNHFSHYAQEPFKIQTDLEYLLNDTFDANVRKIKGLFSLTDEQTKHLRRFEDYKKNGKAVRKTNFKYAFSKESKITEYGLAFFISLFLSKGDAYLFLKKISGFKRDDAPAFKSTIQAFCATTLRLPVERVNSNNSTQAVFLDMCNELARCPKELFDLLPKERQDKFITNRLNNSSEEDEGVEHNDDSLEQEPESRMVRNKSRFVFFAQRYLDVMNALPELRFGIDLGTFYYSIYNKSIAGETVIRQLTKHLIGYGKLDEFDPSQRPEQFANLYKDISPLDAVQKDPYIKEMYPRYVVENNTVPLYFVNNQTQVYWPKVDTAPTGDDKAYPNKLIKDQQPKPFALLSVHELPAMLFYELLRNDNEPGIQAIIASHQKGLRQFFIKVKDGTILIPQPLLPRPESAADKAGSADEYKRRVSDVKGILSQYSLELHHIPDRLIEILIGIEAADWKKNAQRRLEEMKTEAVERLKKMKQREQAEVKPGKKSFRKIKVGKLADILAEDMMLMQPVAEADGKKVVNSKANTTAFRLLQSRLAFYGRYKEEMTVIFKACNLIESGNKHPFLYKIQVADHEGVIEFYKAYFKEKAVFLDTCIRKKQYDQYGFLKLRQSTANAKELASIYLNENANIDYSPMLLPRGLFLKKCIEHFKVNGSDTMKKMLAETEHVNSVYLIDFYFKHKLKDNPQQFYSWEKTYRLFNHEKSVTYLRPDEITSKFPSIQNNIKTMRKRISADKIVLDEDIKDVEDQANRSYNAEAIKNFIVTKYGRKYPAILDIRLNRQRRDGGKKIYLTAVEEVMRQSIAEKEKSIGALQYYMDNEQYLRLVSAQDKLLFMCITKMMEKYVGNINISGSNDEQIQPNTFLLHNVSPVNDTDAKNLLNCTPTDGVTLELPYYEVDGKGNLQKAKAGVIRLADRHVKIKNAGNFRKLARDRRINSLCFYIQPDEKGSKTLNRGVLENELRSYDRCRHRVLQCIANFERDMFIKYKSKAKEYFYRPGLIQSHKLYLEKFYELHTGFDGRQLDFLLSVRNGFLHNQFPGFLQGYSEQFSLPAEKWHSLNEAYQPSQKGSTQGYGIIGSISQAAMDEYQKLTSTLKA